MSTAYHGSSAFFNTGLHGYRYPHFWKKTPENRKLISNKIFPLCQEQQESHEIKITYVRKIREIVARMSPTDQLLFNL